MRMMDVGAKRWLLKTAKANFWRVADWYEFEDLIQDGLWHWCRVVERYEVRPNRVRRTRHLMSLFKLTFINHLHDLSKRNFKLEVHLEDLSPEIVAQLSYAPPQELIAYAPPLVRLTLVVLMTTVGARRLRMSDRNPDHDHMTFNEKLCRIVGLDPRIVNLVDELKRYLKGEDCVGSTYSVMGIK